MAGDAVAELPPCRLATGAESRIANTATVAAPASRTSANSPAPTAAKISSRLFRGGAASSASAVAAGCCADAGKAGENGGGFDAGGKAEGTWEPTGGALLGITSVPAGAGVVVEAVAVEAAIFSVA